MGLRFCARGNVQIQKKPDASPCEYTRVRPRTRFQDDRETSSRNEDTMLLLVFRALDQKINWKLGRFSCTFDWNTAEMSLKPDSRWSGKRFQNTIYTLSEKKQMGFLLFLVKISLWEGKERRFASRFAGGGYAASVASLTLGNRFNLPRDAHGFRFFTKGREHMIATTFNIIAIQKQRRMSEWRLRVPLRWGRAFARLGGLVHTRHLFFEITAETRTA